ncbi:hypothetical protein TWF694_002918 [Orbilia ellipsospora]|uniref:Fucose-specific lectin n=1 Tax=Orbilia ellipsospora TaxID=2528407 RepID=A0AAV9X0Z3_9PEZI
MWKVDPFSRFKPQAEEPTPPEAPNPVEYQPSLPEVVPGGGAHHEQPGLEVVNAGYNVYNPPTTSDSGTAITPESPFEIGKLPPEYEAATINRPHRICGIKRWIFLTLVGIVLVAAIVGGVVGGVLGSRKSSSRPSNPPSPTQTTFPINIAAVENSDGDITLVRQDNNTQLFYIHAMVGGKWGSPITIEGLNPPPSTNTSFAMLQAPNSTTIQIFYTAENNTMFDASGTTDNGNWTMGRLASDTRYGVLVSPQSGFAATPWIVENAEGYSFRVYYVDRTTQSVQELALDSGDSWTITDVRFSTASSKGKVAVAWVQASNFSYTDNQALHVFYQDNRANLVHVPGYNGVWNFSQNCKESTSENPI